jgi:hypothetical protein
MSVFAVQPAMIAPPRYSSTKIQPPAYRAIIPQARNFYPLSSHPANTTRSSTRSSSPSPIPSIVTTEPEPTHPSPTYYPSRSHSGSPAPQLQPRTKPPPYTPVPASFSTFSPSSPTTNGLPRRHLEKEARFKTAYSEDNFDILNRRNEEEREEHQSWWCSCLSVGPLNSYDDDRALPLVAYYVF